MRQVRTIKKIGVGAYKLPQWDHGGRRALVYSLRRVSPRASAQELYLYIYTAQGSGNVFSHSPTIQNREKEPEHDYLGPSWARWKVGEKQFAGICHFFKQQRSTPQHFKLIALPRTATELRYESVVVADKSGPLMVNLHRTASSLAKCFAGEAKKLELPRL